MGFFSDVFKGGLREKLRGPTLNYLHGKVKKEVHGMPVDKFKEKRASQVNERLASETRAAWLAKLNQQRELTLRKRQFGDLATNMAQGSGAGFIYKPGAKAGVKQRQPVMGGPGPGGRGGPVGRSAFSKVGAPTMHN